MPQFKVRKVTVTIRSIFLAELERDKGVQDIAAYLSEIIEAVAAERRMNKKQQQSLAPLPPEGEFVRKDGNDNRRTKCGPKATAKILILLQKHIATPEIARRFGVSTSTVARIKDNFSKATHVPIYHGNGNGRKGEWA